MKSFVYVEANKSLKRRQIQACPQQQMGSNKREQIVLFACGFPQTEQEASAASSHVGFVLCKLLHVAGVLEEPINELDNEATQKAKRFYNSCINVGKHSNCFSH